MEQTCNKLFFDPSNSNNNPKLSISSIEFKLFEEMSMNCKCTQFDKPIVFMSWFFDAFRN